MSTVWMNQLSWVDDEARVSQDQPPAVTEAFP